MNPRRLVVDRLEPFGCGYVDRDTMTARCPVCDGAMGVRFSDVAVWFTCLGAGCEEDVIARVVFGRERETDEMVAKHRGRLAALLTNAACRTAGEQDAGQEAREAA